MRVTSTMIFDQITRRLGKNLESYAGLNSELATGKKFSKPSEDVTGMMRSLDYRVDISANDQYKRNIDEAVGRLKFADTVMSSASSALLNIRTLITQNLSGSLDPTFSDGYALEAAQLRNQLSSLANTKYRDQYLFAGYRTDTQPYNAGLAYQYQGDNGVMNVSIDKSSFIPVNVTGNETFSYTLAAAYVKQISGNRFAHYTPGAGTTVDVEIRDTDDITVLDTFSFSNAIQMTDTLSTAISANNSLRIEALADPFNKMSTRVLTTQSEVGARLSGLNDQTDRHTANTLNLKNSLSAVEDADPLETAVELKKLEVSLQALRESASKILSQSLMDFLT